MCFKKKKIKVTQRFKQTLDSRYGSTPAAAAVPAHRRRWTAEPQDESSSIQSAHLCTPHGRSWTVLPGISSVSSLRSKLPAAKPELSAALGALPSAVSA